METNGEMASMKKRKKKNQIKIKRRERTKICLGTDSNHANKPTPKQEATEIDKQNNRLNEREYREKDIRLV